MTKQPTARARVAQAIRAEIEGATEVRLDDLTQTIFQRFQEEPGFAHDWFRETMLPFAKQFARQIIAAERGDLRPMGDVFATQGALKKRIDTLAEQSDWSRWLEHANGRYVALPAMTRDDLLAAIANRRRLGDAHHAVANILETFVGKLKPTQTVGERFSDKQIAAAFAGAGPTVDPAVPTSLQVEQEAAD